MAHDRNVAGIRCLEVLSHLSDYLDGELDTDTRGRIDAHLAGCDWCERFGGELANLLHRVRRDLAEPPPLDDGIQERLRATLGIPE